MTLTHVWMTLHLLCGTPVLIEIGDYRGTAQYVIKQEVQHPTDPNAFGLEIQFNGREHYEYYLAVEGQMAREGKKMKQVDQKTGCQGA